MIKGEELNAEEQGNRGKGMDLAGGALTADTYRDAGLSTHLGEREIGE